MKQAFEISYRAPFGQSMHVCLKYIDVEQHERQADLLMHTEDGNLWTVETMGSVVSHTPVRSIVYHYQLEDDDGKPLRSEFAGVPRFYVVDPTKNYHFCDIWRDLPLQTFLYPPAKRKVTKMDTIPFFNESVLFRVSAPHVTDGQSVALLGSEPTLGAWSEKRYLLMRYVGNGDWMLSINAYALHFPFEFKYVVVDDKSHDIIAWEKGTNRKVNIKELKANEQLVIYGGLVRTKCRLACHDEWLGGDFEADHEIQELYI